MNFYEFIDQQTALTSSLYDLTAARKGTEAVQFLQTHVEAFNEKKRQLCAAPRLAHSYLEGPFTLYTDASKIAFGALLLQAMLQASSALSSFCSKRIIIGAEKLFYLQALVPRDCLRD